MSNHHSDAYGLMIDAADVRTVARDGLQIIRTHLLAIGAACSDAELMKMITAAQNQVTEVDDVIAGQIAFLTEDLQMFIADAQGKAMGHAIPPPTLGQAKIKSRDDLSFTKRDAEGRMINWPIKNPGVANDWEKGIGFFDVEIAELAGVDETEAYDAIACAIRSMGGHYTCLEIGFSEAVARATVLGLRAIRNGAAQFEPVDEDEPAEEVA